MIIPVDIDKLPSSPKPLDDSQVYRVRCTLCEPSPRPDKNGRYYLRLGFSVIAPEEYRGRVIFDNYVRLPVLKEQLRNELGREPTPQEIEDEAYRTTRLVRLVRAFTVPHDSNGIDMTKILGREGLVTVRNEEFPVGSGEIRSRVKDYVTT